MIRRVLVAGGGTGGHLFPGIAVVEEMRRRLPDLDVLFVGTERGIEARVLPRLGERFSAVDVKPLMGRSPLQLTRNVLSLPRSGVHALSTVRSFRPDLAIGLGGYAAGPVLLAASALRVPCALLEQNAHVGLTNRLLKRTVGRAYLTFEETAGQFGHERARVLGNPVRRAFVDAARMAGHDPAGVEARSRTVLVLGGSQGARTLNQQVPEGLWRAGVGAMDIRIVHQTGPSMVEEVDRRYRDLGLKADVVPFIEDMARAYTNASMVIARAGATTLAELCAVGRPSILVPYPHAAQDHQAMNALALEGAGAAVAIREEDLTVDVLAEHARTMLTDTDLRRRMAEAARRRGRPEAAAAIVDDLFGWLGVSAPSAPASDEGDDLGEAATGHGPSAAAMGTLSVVPVRRRARVKRRELRLTPLEQPTEPRVQMTP
ncbi:MAG: undecaprenyldiphospho-muramoylpentapeptide beta-N-acetylglucosaminyltransferase [Myxococcales bacterium]|jgi:UDP-N-acetylglucosamine--N-acetylmuramyl-(pentapeptide) pyrophosphoryl-undecaprenol N-acetylglucosamine transferase